MIVVSDTSAITSLLQIGKANLLQLLYGRVLIPDAVQAELLRTHLEIPSFVEVHYATNRERVRQLETQLDRGEAEAIVLAQELKADLLLMDDQIGRAVARREGLRITGLAGVAVDAKRREKISSVRELLAQLEGMAGFRISAAVKAEALRLAGE
jgi:predicted nucleic acid-binding protein